jgi:hypothetical protein
MRTHTRLHRHDEGWNAPLPTDEDSPQTLVLAFASPRYGDEPAALQALRQAFPRSLVVGCSSAGEIAGRDLHDDSISVAVSRFEHTGLRLAATPLTDAADSQAAGQRLAAQLLAQAPAEGVGSSDAPLRAVLLVSCGLSVNGSALTRGLQDGLPNGVVISGGLAGDGSRFERTWVFDGQDIQAHSALAIGLYGPRLQVSHGCEGGWQGFGPPRRITRAEGHVLYELDGQPALALYKKYLGDLADHLPGSALLFPLTVSAADDPAGETLVRTVLAVDEDHQSMTFAGDLPLGGTARLMRANAEQLIDSAGRAARAARGQDTAAPPAALVISVSCVGRRMVLGERTEEEADAVLDHSPAGAAHVGWYSYGEISPSAETGEAALHNQTMTVTVLTEA